MATNQPCIQPCTSHLTSIASGLSIFTSKVFLEFRLRHIKRAVHFAIGVNVVKNAVRIQESPR